MSDKILTEAFDKIKAIEESDDPFCVNEGSAESFEELTAIALQLDRAYDELKELFRSSFLELDYEATAALNKIFDAQNYVISLNDKVNREFHD